MYVKTTTLVVSFLATSLATAAQLDERKVDLAPSQISQYSKDVNSFVSSEYSQPQATSLGNEIDPYISGVGTAGYISYVRAQEPTDVKDIEEWVTHPLLYATAGPEPKFVKDMPTKVRSDFVSFVHEQLSAAASLANKDLLANGVAPNIMPGLGWALGAAAGAVGVVAVML